MARPAPDQAGAGAIAWIPTLHAKGTGPLRREHLRRVPAAPHQPQWHLLLLDCSGSMLRQGRLALAKGWVQHLMDAVVRAGHEVAVIGFGGDGVHRLWGATATRPRVALQALGGGGGTPLRQALTTADTALRRARRSGRSAPNWLWLLSDGRSLDDPPRPAADGLVVLDFDDPLCPVGRGAVWAARWQAHYQSAHAPGTRPPWKAR